MIIYVPYFKSIDVTIRKAQTTRYTWNLVKNNFLQKMTLKYNAKFTGDVTGQFAMTEVCSNVPIEAVSFLPLFFLKFWTFTHSFIYSFIFRGCLSSKKSMMSDFSKFTKFNIRFREKLRAQKECSLYAGCLVFEVLFGLTYTIAGAHRLYVHNSNRYYPLNTAFGCLLQPHLIFFVYITPCVVSMMFLMVALMPIPFLVASFTTTSQITSTPTIIECALNTATTEEVYFTLRATRVVFSLLGASLYIPIIIRIRMFCTNSSRKLLRTTSTVLLICVSTLSLYTIPDIVLLINPHFSSKFYYVANLNKGVVNVFIFIITQRAIRDAVIKVLRGKR
ncbi:hypothetical protein PMAYCL1PPCAC_04598, partial [Pristionchus mayeri]